MRAPQCFFPLFKEVRIMEYIDMNPKNRIFSSILILCVSFLATTINASPRNVNSEKNLNTSLKLSAAQLMAQKALTEAAYIRLLKISKNKVKQQQLSKAIVAKPRLIKSSFKSDDSAGLSKYNKRLKVTATAYTSHANQTDSTPNIAAWGDRLKPGMKVIAVSRDLLKVYGLKHKQKVRIKGLKGEYMVLDKMNKRWRKKIDIYMGMDKKKAFRWGRRKVEILWNS